MLLIPHEISERERLPVGRTLSKPEYTERVAGNLGNLERPGGRSITGTPYRMGSLASAGKYYFISASFGGQISYYLGFFLSEPLFL